MNTASFGQQLLMFDAQGGHFRCIKLRAKQAGCVVCGETPTVTELQDYESFCGSSATDKVSTMSQSEGLGQCLLLQILCVLLLRWCNFKCPWCAVYMLLINCPKEGTRDLSENMPSLLIHIFTMDCSIWTSRVSVLLAHVKRNG